VDCMFLLLTILFNVCGFVADDILRFIFLFLGLFVFIDVFFCCFFPGSKTNDWFRCCCGRRRCHQRNRKCNDVDVGDCTKVSTFMNLYHVHVNRMPVDGRIIDCFIILGRIFQRFKKESEKTNASVLWQRRSWEVKIIQIAGRLPGGSSLY